MWGRARLVDGFDSRRARPGRGRPGGEPPSRTARADPAVESRPTPAGRRPDRPDLARRPRDGPQSNGRPGCADQEPAARRDGLRRAASRSAADLRAAPGRRRAARRGGPARDAVLRAGARSRSSLSRIPRMRERAAPHWPTGSPARPITLTWRSIANRALALPFRPRAGRHAQRLRPEWLEADAPGPARLAGRRAPRRCGQSLKSIHRLIVTSAVYRQSSRDDPAAARIDADNRWLWRMNRQRLDAEELRDSVLAVSGTLDSRRWAGRASRCSGSRTTTRRSTTTPPLRRSTIPGCADGRSIGSSCGACPNPFLDCMDGADPNVNTPVRSTTITALQALALLNDVFMVKQSHEFARQTRVVSTATRRDRSKPRSLRRWADLRGRPSATPWPHTSGSTAWPTPAGCCSIRMSSCSLIESMPGPGSRP